MYTNKFSKYLLNKKPIIKKIINALLEKYEYASCLATDVQGTLIRVNKNVTSVTDSTVVESGFVFKIKGKDTYSELSINDVNDKNYDEVLKLIDELGTKSINAECINSKVLLDEELKRDFIRKNNGKDYTVDELISILKDKVNEYVKNDIVNIYSSIETKEYSKMFISKNRELTQYYTWTNSTCYAISSLNDEIKEMYDGQGSSSIDEAISKLDDSFKYATEIATELHKAKNPIPGIYDIITNPSVTGLIVHEAFGHGVEMDMFVKDRAKSVEYLNKYVASDLVTMHDGAASALSAASYFFDDEGVLAQDTTIIEKGILKRGISDALSAMELGTIPTGNSRRQSYKRKAYTRMTNTFFEDGKDKLDDMIKSIDYGYMIFDTNNGMEDPKNWGIQCTAMYGREIKNGKFTGNIISPVVMSGYVIDLLKSISMVSTGLEVNGSGSCGKGYKEWVRVSDGGSCLKARVKIG